MDEDTTPTLSESKELFLELIAAGARDADAVELTGVHRVTVFRWKKTDPEFKARYDAVREIRLEHLIKEAERRAMAGSDKMLEFLLCNYAPDRFSNRQKVEAGGVLSLIVATGVPTDDGSDLAG